eukprot:3126943-Pyramimonas_sp.AAC.1
MNSFFSHPWLATSQAASFDTGGDLVALLRAREISKMRAIADDGLELLDKAGNDRTLYARHQQHLNLFKQNPSGRRLHDPLGHGRIHARSRPKLT